MPFQRANPAFEAVGTDGDAVPSIASGLEAVGREFSDERFLKNDLVQPFDSFDIEEVG